MTLLRGDNSLLIDQDRCMLHEFNQRSSPTDYFANHQISDTDWTDYYE